MKCELEDTRSMVATPPDLPECARCCVPFGVAQAIRKRLLFTKNASSTSETQT